MDPLNCERALYRRQRTNAGVSAFQFLHDQAIRRVTYACASVVFEVWRVKALRAHARNQMVRKFTGTMARNDFRQNFLLHKLCRPIARSPLLIGEEFFDFVVIERIHGASELMPASLA